MAAFANIEKLANFITPLDQTPGSKFMNAIHRHIKFMRNSLPNVGKYYTVWLPWSSDVLQEMWSASWSRDELIGVYLSIQ